MSKSDGYSVAGPVGSSKDRYVAFAFSRADILIEILADGRITFVTGAVGALLGLDAAALVGTPLSRLIAPAARAVEPILRDAARTGARLPPTPVTLANGARQVTGDIAGCPLTRATGHYFLTFAVGAFVAAREPEPPRPPTPTTDPLGWRDPETGLLNRNGLAATAEKVAHADDAGRRLTFLDVAVGDDDDRSAIAREVGSALRELSVDRDAAAIVAPNRFGVLHEASVAPQAIQARVTEALRALAPGGERAVTARTVSLGGARAAPADLTRALVFAVNRFADARNAADAADLPTSLDGLIRLGLARVTEVRQTFAQGRFALHYQPIVDLATMRIHHQEALTRLPDGSSPFATVLFAEEVGLIADLDLEIVGRALVALAEAPDALDVAVNVSGRSLDNPAFATRLGALLDRHREVRRRLIIEITESSRIHDLVRVAAVIDDLRRAGHKICLDDFGSGSAAFHYLRALPVDTIKIDGLYVREIERRPRDRAFVAAISALARELACQTVAEMVEKPEHADRLAAMRVDFGQGFLFGKARTAIHRRDAANPERWIDIKAWQGATRREA
jgi:EAL domain-containing protein (putative c-di-GMP-specific phosphodiesterase class I)